ncbi:phosphodiesterase [Mycolicibacterium sp. S2-37]|uniref:phosphodiesterase n=1 Tax=Mycolicibacterium sp. S2-37 TaxID=2810297 RepID=UPI001A94EF02|nr:phosphodiesterase [Mycolicibacterium sp. S2-37]MBO0681007.1 phosphodiesterase [Mycolicibacterium sp. S2-37]
MPCIGAVKPAPPVCPRAKRGNLSSVKVSDVLSLPIELGAAIRHRRLFHPSGVLVRGRIERVAPAGEGLPMESGDVIGRISKGVGLPRATPDVAGLAWRTQTDAGPWDVLLASTGGGGLSRVLLRPAASWGDAFFSSLMPFGYNGGTWWVRARLTTELDVPGLSLDAITGSVARGELAFDVEQAAGTGEFRPLARLSFTEVVPPDRDLSFDPTLNSAPGVDLLPGWLTTFRRSAYKRSRQGRDAE